MTVGGSQEEMAQQQEEQQDAFSQEEAADEFQDFDDEIYEYHVGEKPLLEDVIEEEEELYSGDNKGSISSDDSIEDAIFKMKDAKLRTNFIKYMKVLSDINTKNEEVKQIKEVIKSRYCKESRSFADDQEIDEFRRSFYKQYRKLRHLLNKAVRLQSIDPSRQWRQIEFETTLEEDMLCGQFSYKMAGF